MQTLSTRAFPTRTWVNGLWYCSLALTLLVLVAALPGYAERVFNLAREPIDAPAAFVFAARGAGALASLATALLCIALALVLYTRRRDDRMAVFVAFYLLLYGVLVAGPVEALEWWDARWAEWGLRLQSALLLTPSIFLFALFPNGKFVPAWMRYPVLATLITVPALLFVTPNDWQSIAAPLTILANLILLGIGLLGLYAQVYRYRHVSTPLERQQTKVFVFGFALWLVCFALVTIPYVLLMNLPGDAPRPWWSPVSQLAWWLTLMILPVSLAISILRYRLWDIDLVINRALVYGLMTVLVVGMYVLLVGGIGALFQSNVNWFISLLATGIVAVLFQPLRERVQRAINRLVYGERDDPYSVLARLGARLEATLETDALLPAIVETIAQALKVSYVAIELTTDDGQPTTAASFPSPLVRPSSSTLRLPLTYHSETLGELVLGARAGEEKFSPADMRLLNDLARQAGIAVHAVRLTADLQQSRERIVTAREEERRRIRRDLHDGLGPSLAALTLELDAARNLLKRDPDAAEELLRELKAQTQGALADIRRLVYALRPPALDELGLDGALREQLTRYNGVDGLNVRLNVPEPLPPLPAAVEVAAYRIVTEAVTNTIKHAHARVCEITLRVNGDLNLEIRDDGVGLPNAFRSGLGLHSMHERAEELGGTCVIENHADKGTRVRVRLPLSR